VPNKFISLVCNNFGICNSFSGLKVEWGRGELVD